MSQCIPIALLFLYTVLSSEGSNLILVHTLFRHGERTSDTRFMYPTDPYKNETFLPYGNGQLTNVGKQTMYNLGKALRHRYNEFLGEVFLPEMVDAWASSLPRTQAALQLVLTGLFPPKGPLIWEEDLKWQPIVYRFLSKETDTLLLSMLLDSYVKKYDEYCKSPEAQSAMMEAEPVLAYIRKHSGLRAYTPRVFFFLYITLITEDHYGLELPQWTHAIYPHPISDLIHLEFDLEMGNRELRKSLLGHMMQKILTDTENAIKGNSKCKMHMYSAHDVNIVYFLRFFGQMYKHAPGYSACIALEIHEENGKYFAQVYYKSDKSSSFELLPFDDGSTRLYLDKFRKLVADLLDDGSPKQSIGTANNASTTFDQCITAYQTIFLFIFFRYIVRS